MPASTSSVRTHSSRIFSARVAMQVISGPADLGAGLLGEARQSVRTAGGRLEVVPQAAGGGDLFLPVDVQREPVLREQLLLGLSLVGAGHVGGRHGDQVGGRTRGGHGRGDPGGTEQVDLDGLGQGGVEGDGGGRVDDDVAGGQGGPALVVEPEAILPDVAGDGPDPAGHLGGEAVAQLGAEAVEAVVADHLAGQAGPRHRPVGRGGPVR